MTDGAQSNADALAAALVSAFPDYVESRLAALGVEPEPELIRAAESGCIGLGVALDELIARPAHQQRQSPLELVRNATQPLAEALADMGVTPPTRDSRGSEIHPEDVYDLFPATSRDLGDEVWRLHMQWGFDRARVVAGIVPAPPEPAAAEVAGGPAVALFGLTPDRREAITAAAAALGYRTLVWRNPAALDAGLTGAISLVLVALDHPNAHDAIRATAAAGSRAVAVGEGVDDFATAAVMALGAEAAVELDQVLERFPGFLPRVV